MNRLLKIALVAAAVSSSALTTGCAQLYADLGRDRRDTAWDPRPGQTLFDQLPEHDGAARVRCGGQYSPEDQRRLGLSPRC